MNNKEKHASTGDVMQDDEGLKTLAKLAKLAKSIRKASKLDKIHVWDQWVHMEGLRRDRTLLLETL